MTQEPADSLGEITATLKNFTALLDAAPEPEAVLQTLCGHLVQIIAGADLASISVITRGAARTVASTEPRARELDREQYARRSGPCVSAAETGKIVRAEVGQAGHRWPEFADYALGLGVGSYLAAPLTVDETLSGAVNLFGYGSHGFQEIDASVLEMYTAVVAFGLRAMRKHHTSLKVTTHLRRAVATRATIEQAKGILMALHKLSADDAFQRLVDTSQRQNRKLYVVAAEFVERSISRH